jgi:hypothetical protein
MFVGMEDFGLEEEQAALSVRESCSELFQELRIPEKQPSCL